MGSRWTAERAATRDGCPRAEVCGDAGTLEILMIDEATRTTKFEVDMLIAAVSSILDENTRVALIGDPCQTKTTLRTLQCTASLRSADALSISALEWVLCRNTEGISLSSVLA